MWKEEIWLFASVKVRAVEVLIKVFTNVDYLFVSDDESAVIACF